MTAYVAGRLPRGWPQLPPAWRRGPAWPAVLAALAFVGLLLAFQQVVSGSVRQGEIRRANTLAQADAAWRCNTLRGTRTRESCLMQLNATPGGDTAQPAGDVEAVATAQATVPFSR